MKIEEIPLDKIIRPLKSQNDAQKVNNLMKSMAEIALQEPIDVLEVDGQY